MVTKFIIFNLFKVLETHSVFWEFQHFSANIHLVSQQISKMCAYFEKLSAFFEEHFPAIKIFVFSRLVPKDPKKAFMTAIFYWEIS